MANAIDRGGDGGRSLGRSGALIGLVLGAGLGAMRMMGGGQPDSVSTGNLALMAAYALPFAVALGAARLDRATMRAAVWLGCGALGLLGSITAFSGVSLVLLLPASLLIVASVQAMRAGDTRPEWPVVVVPAWIVAVGILAFVALFQRDDPRSWSDANSGHWVSDVITPSEGLTSLGVWVAGLLVLATALWLWELAARRS